MSKKVVAASAADIPIDVMIDILARVPVKSLLRFKSVRKSWYSLIQSPNFIAKQLRYALTIEENYCAIVKHHVPDSNRLAISFLPDKTDSSVTDLTLDNPVPIPFFDELVHKLGYIEVLFCGTCNGIICAYGAPYNKHRLGGVTYTVWGFDNEHMQGDLISLWNPATREMKRLPFSNFPRCGEDRCTNLMIGFGFDSWAKDYKVVKILSFKGEALPVIEVYNSSSNIWRKIDAVVPAFERSSWTPSIYLDGFCYWYSGVDSDFTTILSFDFVNEVFDAFPIPDSLIVDEYSETARTLLKYKESLAIAARGFPGAVYSTSLYVLERDGNTKTWSKLLEIDNQKYYVLLGILRNEVALMRISQYDYASNTQITQLVWYDLKSQQVLRSYGKGKVIDFDYSGIYLVNYVGSLVTFKESNEFDER